MDCAYIQSSIDGVKMKKPGESKSGITDEDKEIILSALFKNLKIQIKKTGWKRLILIWDNTSYHVWNI